MSRSRRDATKTSGKVLSGGKRLVFKIISILLPFLILFLIEISLRIFHYGYDLNLFIEARNNPGLSCTKSGSFQKIFYKRGICTNRE